MGPVVCRAVGAQSRPHPGVDHPVRAGRSVSDYLTNEIVAEALGGLLFTIGTPGREPLKMGGNPALHSAGGAAFSAIMAALWQRDRTGQGQQIDLSIQEATAITQIHASIEATWLGTDAQRTASELVEARDGWVSTGLETGVSPETWPRVCELLGRPELVDDPRFASGAARRDHRDALKDVVREWVRGQDKEDVYHLLQGLRSIAGYVATAADVYRAGICSARFFQEIDHPVAGGPAIPGSPSASATSRGRRGERHCSGSTPRRSRRRSPHQRVVRIARRSVDERAAAPVYALDGVRILDLTQVAVGPYATFPPVEPGRRGDQGRVPPASGHGARSGASRGRAPDEAVPAWEPGERPWNRGAHYNQRNRGKLGITLDLTAPAGKEIFKRLAARSDAVIENYRASVMERQGLGYDVLRAVNPRLVYVKLSSQGDSGPERDYGSLGSTLEQTTGLASITGYLDRVPLTTGRVYPDPVAGLLAVGALIAGLRQARRRGVGSLVDCSQREMTVGLLGEAMMDYAFNGACRSPPAIAARAPPRRASTRARAATSGSRSPSRATRSGGRSGRRWVTRPGRRTRASRRRKAAAPGTTRSTARWRCGRAASATSS
jgi:crotonobetainyl-CoA:carnitine CoA-transferase CaiB-like acyl-CoA transferase